LDDLPKTLGETYERALQGIDEEKWRYVHRLFQSLTVSVRPLHVEELAEVLAIQLDAEEIPEFSADWRPEDVEDAVLSACSSLISVVTVDDVRVVQFSHFTVKEFLTSKRLSNSKHVSRYHILLQPAHTFLARACLSVLLNVDDQIDKTRIEEFPLARYAAKHWVDHAQFEDVSQHIQDGMERLFDRDKPHFAAWVWVYDIDDPFGLYMYHTHPEKPNASPLYYAVLCGFYDMTERLIISFPQDVNSRGGQHATPLHAALRKERVDITQLLLGHGADVNSKGYEDRTPLHIALQWGDVGIIQAHTRDKFDWTSLHLASRRSHLDVLRLLLDRGADANAQTSHEMTPLHFAACNGHFQIAEVLLAHGVDPRIRNKKGQTAFEQASEMGHLEVAQLLSDLTGQGS